MNSWLYLLMAIAVPAWCIPGDLDLDGDVDFDDFFFFADNFGKTGPPDTLRVVVTDTLVGYMNVTIFDTTIVTIHDTIVTEIEQVVFDTVIVADPIPGEFTTREQALLVFDPFDPLDKLRWNFIRHFTENVRLGPGLERNIYGFMEITYFEDGKKIEKTYLKPSGHLFNIYTGSYATEVTFHEDGNVEFWYREINESGQYVTTTRYLFDSETNVVDEILGGTCCVGGEQHYYFTLQDGGTYTSESAKNEFSQGYTSKTYTYEPVNFDTELAK